MSSNKKENKGPGTELKNIIQKWTGQKHKENGCDCARHELEMNKRGIEWCEQNIKIITLWLKIESQKRKLPFHKGVASLMIKRAIKNAKKKNL